MGWGVSIWYGVLVNRIGVSKRDMLVNGLECKYTGFGGVCIWDGVFV